MGGSEDDDGGEHGDSHAGAGGGQGGAGDRQARLEDCDGGGTGDGADIAGRDLSETLCGKDAGETQHGVWGHDGQVEHCRETGMDELTEEVAGSLAFFARERITPFIREQGGWETLCQVFPFDPEDPERRVWRGLLLVGITLAILTLFLAARR